MYTTNYDTTAKRHHILCTFLMNKYYFKCEMSVFKAQWMILLQSCAVISKRTLVKNSVLSRIKRHKLAAAIALSIASATSGNIHIRLLLGSMSSLYIIHAFTFHYTKRDNIFDWYIHHTTQNVSTDLLQMILRDNFVNKTQYF